MSVVSVLEDLRDSSARPATISVSKLEAQTVLIDGYPIDITTGETHTFPLEVTSYPVEKGADIADHVRAKPMKISLECIVSDTPIGAVAGHTTRRDGSIPSGVIYQKLLKMRQDGEPLVVSTSLDVFEDMVMSDLSIPRESGEPHQLRFKIEFTQFIFVTNNRTTVRVATPGGEGTKHLGERLAVLDPGFYKVFSVKENDPRIKNGSFALLIAGPPGPALHSGGYYRFLADAPHTPVPDGFVNVDDKGERTYIPYNVKFDPNVAAQQQFQEKLAQDQSAGGIGLRAAQQTTNLLTSIFH